MAEYYNEELIIFIEHQVTLAKSFVFLEHTF